MEFLWETDQLNFQKIKVAKTSKKNSDISRVYASKTNKNSVLQANLNF